MANHQTNDAWVKIGRVGRTYGVQGWQKVDSYTQKTTNILDYSPWYLSELNEPSNESDLMQVVLEAGRSHGKSIVVKIPGYNSPEQARQLTGKNIFIKQAQLPPLSPHEYYWSDLIGLKVINRDGTLLGTVKYLLETGSNDVLVVQGDKEIAIPYLPQTVILSVDLDAKTITVDWELL